MTKAKESEIAKLKKQLAKVGKVKSVITAKTETKKSVLGNFVIIYEKATESGFVPLRISYAPFENRKAGMISIRQWNGKMKCHNYVSFNVELTFGTLAKMVSKLEACDFTKYTQE